MAAEIYRQLAESVGVGDSKYIPGVFEILADENEAKVLMAASPPATIDELAEKTGLEAGDIEEMIDPLFKKGLLFKSRKEDATRYYRVRHVLQFHDSAAVMEDAPREMLDLWKAFMAEEFGDFNRKFEELIPGPVIRVVPVNVSIESGTQILAFDDVKNLVEEARSIAVTRCSCRVIDGACGKELWNCMQFNKAADYAVERGTGRALTKEETIELLKRCEEEGLVHISENKRSIGHVICNCCEDCCLNWAALRTGSGKFVAPSRFLAEVDADACISCEACLERCYFEAISMTGENDTSSIDAEKCMGCGLCLITCPEEAISLKEVRAQDFVPA
ncbi:4Fe-4S dicluster-binding protein [Thermodesulfobacteriota bacterium]